MSVRLLPLLLATGCTTAALLGLHALTAPDQGGVAVTVGATAAPSAAPAPAPRVVVPAEAPTAAPAPDVLPTLWGALNGETAAYVSGEMRMLSELERAMADQLAGILSHARGH